MSVWNDEPLRKLFLSATPLIDVRAPVEFADGALPHSINLPIINDQERVLIGTCYKEQGQEAAVKLGHQLVSGSIKEERVRQWQEYLEQYPATQIFCFRGGMRSQIACQWLAEKNIQRTALPGGYKRMRTFFLSYLNEAPLPTFYRLGGCTGSGKTRLLKKISNSIDLEHLANHRGSAFGGNGVQPSQVSFENRLAMGLMQNEKNKVLLEDESITIGKCSIPNRLFESMRNSPLISLKISDEERIKNIFHDYVMESDKTFFLDGLERIKKRLSSLIFTTIQEEIHKSFDQGLNLSDHAFWISLLLEHYYDPLYQKDIKRQQSQICFEGNESEVLEYFKSL